MLLLLLGSVLGLRAQHQSVFGRARVVGGFAAPIMEMGLNNDLSTAVGGGAGLVINSVFIGGYGMGSTDFQRLFETGDVENLEMGHGGFWLGFTISPQDVIHLYGSGRVGWGALDINWNDGRLRYQDLDKIFVATPEIGLEMNIARWLRVNGTIGYRYVDGVETQGLTNEEMSGAVIGVGIRLGWFGNRRWY